LGEGETKKMVLKAKSPKKPSRQLAEILLENGAGRTEKGIKRCVLKKS